jgi:protein-disulfide isomerase
VLAGVRPAALYDAIIAGGKVAGIPLRVEVPPPSKAAPTRGPKSAPITVDVFSDFQCPHCREHAKRLAQLEQAFAGKLRLVFHNNPLPSHHHARAAAILGLEAKRQAGDKGFWKMHDLLFFDADAGLDRAGLEAKAASARLDLAAVKKALDGTRFDQQLEADAELAGELEVRAAPMTFINGYVLRGAQPLVKMKRIARLALTEAEAKAQPKK